MEAVSLGQIPEDYLNVPNEFDIVKGDVAYLL